MATELVGLEFLRKNEIKNKTCDPARPYAFISYSHDEHDAQIVMNVFKALYNRGYNLWIDTANMPHTEEEWTFSAIKALKNHNCRFAFFFRSESSMAKSTIAKELETIKKLHHVGDIVTVDIWSRANNTAEHVYEDILNNAENDEALFSCIQICKIVKIANSAIRLAADAGNDISKLVKAMEEELRDRNVMPVDSSGGGETSGGGTSGGGTSGGGGDPEVKSISLPAFLKKYNNNTFKKETFQQVRLAGQGEYAVYNTPFFDSAYPLVWSFVMKLLEERGEDYLHFVNTKNSGNKNPPFITAQEHRERKEQKHPVTYRSLELPGLEGWSMCRHYGQYGWINDVLRRRMLELGLSLEDFSLEYIPGQGSEPAGGAPETVNSMAETEDPPQAQTVTETAQPDNRITGPVPLGGYASPSGGKKTIKMKLPEMVAAGKVCAGDGVYVKKRPDQRGTITADGEIAYNGQILSLNKYVKAVLGDGSYNAYIYVYHEKTGKLLDDLK